MIHKTTNHINTCKAIKYAAGAVFSFILFLATCVEAQSTTEQQVHNVDMQNLRLYFDDGINFTLDPQLFLLRMKFRIQNRYSFEDYDDDSSKADVSEFLNRRVRLRFDGFVLNKNLTYKLQFSFSRHDMDWENGRFPNILRDANVSYQFTDNDQILVGLAKLPGNRQRVISSGQQEFVDRSIANALLNIDRDVGLQWWHRFGSEKPLWLKTAITNGQGRGSAQPNNGMSYTYRLEWLPLGTFKDNSELFYEGDLSFEEKLRISLGAGMNATLKATRTGGQIGADIADGAPRDLETFIADALFKYRGWAWSSEYFRRNAENPAVDAKQTLFDGQGWNTQLSYTWRSMSMIGVRWAQTRPDDNVASLLQRENQYSFVIGKYINKHTIKVQSDVSYHLLTAPHLATQDNWIYRVQLELGI